MQHQCTPQLSMLYATCCMLLIQHKRRVSMCKLLHSSMHILVASQACATYVKHASYQHADCAIEHHVLGQPASLTQKRVMHGRVLGEQSLAPEDVDAQHALLWVCMLQCLCNDDMPLSWIPASQLHPGVFEVCWMRCSMSTRGAPAKRDVCDHASVDEHEP